MSAIEEILRLLDAINAKIENIAREAGGAESATDDAIAQAVALGVTATAEGLSQVKEEIQQLLNQLVAAGDTAKHAATAARAMAEST
jgi:hypothetical protein